jgi:SAM-dependent methyltransferase
MSSAQSQGDLWGQAPADWAQLQEPKHIPLFEAMLKAGGVDADTRVLDAGCGGGGASVLAAQRGAKVSGLDAAEPFIRIAQERVPSGDFRVGDLETLPFGDDAFDVVIAANSVQYAGDRVAALRELGRVCTPGGQIVVGLFGPAETVAFRHVLTALREAMSAPPPGDGPFGLSAPGRLDRLVEQAGLKVTERGEADCPFSYPDLETYLRANICAGPVQGLIRAIGEGNVRTTLQGAARAFTNDEGRIDISPNIFRFVVAQQ